ncbi:hypothetical protein [Desulfolithobacter sp.]
MKKSPDKFFFGIENAFTEVAAQKKKPKDETARYRPWSGGSRVLFPLLSCAFQSILRIAARHFTFTRNCGTSSSSPGHHRKTPLFSLEEIAKQDAFCALLPDRGQPVQKTCDQAQNRFRRFH